MNCKLKTKGPLRGNIETQSAENFIDPMLISGT